MNTNDEFNKRDILSILQKEIETIVRNKAKEPIDDITINSIKQDLNKTLTGLQNEGTVSDYSVDCGLKEVTWRDLYGWKALWAIFFRKVIAPIFKIPIFDWVDYPRWYHKLFLFKINSININKQVHDHIYENFIENGDDEDKHISWYELQEFLFDENNKRDHKKYCVSFSLPGIYLVSNISLKPIKSVEEIKINFELK